MSNFLTFNILLNIYLSISVCLNVYFIKYVCMFVQSLYLYIYLFIYPIFPINKFIIFSHFPLSSLSLSLSLSRSLSLYIYIYDLGLNTQQTSTCGLFYVKVILVEQQWYYLTHSLGDNWVHAFPKSISLKVNLLAQLKFGHAYLEITANKFGHNTRSSTAHMEWVLLQLKKRKAKSLKKNRIPSEVIYFQLLRSWKSHDFVSFRALSDI